jgi:hypothetical protein
MGTAASGANGRGRRAPVVLLGAGLFAAACTFAYLRWIRPWHLGWGATEEEKSRPMVGDDEIPDPQLDATRAISIAAPATAVWPWLLQMGYKRAGFYSYRFDNAWVPSPWYILPEFQTLQVGDIMPTGPGQGFTVKSMEPDRSLLLVVDQDPLRVSAAILLDQVAQAETRMVGRVRVRFGGGIPVFLYRLLFDLGDFIMMRKMFLGIKERAERWTAADRGGDLL